ncbi:MAG: hypothetical protein CMH64_01160 [Nanoarchaeota archaeon]|nr:hypothetical protein [Nanoarchaeota archaeon]|tara:strand:+ start:549 stop:746 length:198 start_codon:yes stop_codon:yes gene_type:complete
MLDIEKFTAKMDTLGALAFLYVIIYSIINLMKEMDILTVILLLIGVVGFLVDMFIVIKVRMKNVK